MGKWLRQYFEVASLSREIFAGFTTFLTMAYIVMVNPLLLKDAGLNPEAVFVATCLISALASIAMGLYANYPIAVAPGLSMATYFSYVVVGQMGYSWQIGLGAIGIAGILFLLVSLLKLRAYIIEAIPECLKIALTCGIGLFIAMIAMKNAQIINIVPSKLIEWNQPLSPPAIFTYLGVMLIAAFSYFRVPGAILITMLSLTVLGGLYDMTTYHGILSLPPSLNPTLFSLRFPSELWNINYWNIVLSIFFVAFFDSTGTLLGLLYQAGMPTTGKDPRFAKALTVDSSASILGACMGTATVGAYIENAAGVAVGGRSGLTAIVVGSLFLSALFLSPLTQTIPSFATASALLFVAYLMLQNIRRVNWRDPAALASTLVTITIMPLTFSIAYGIASGFLVYLVTRSIQGQLRAISNWQWMLGGLFFSYMLIKFF